VADQASSTIVIDAPPETVLSVIRDLPAYPEWTGGISKVTVLEEGKAGPKRATFAMSQSGLSDEYTLEYDWQADGVAWKLAEPSKLQKSQTGSYRLKADGSKTHVTYLLTMDIKVPMIGLMKRKAEKMIIDSALKELKKRAESLG
jgi:ribosome-associated toxin RatA of RatAB toxin-antitoxin module